jgi:hypothetical protein
MAGIPGPIVETDHREQLLDDVEGAMAAHCPSVVAMESREEQDGASNESDIVDQQMCLLCNG